MNDQIKNTVTEAATNAVLDVLAAQPWWRRYANTVFTVASGVATFGTWALTTELGLPAPAKAALGLLVLIASVVGARATRNGVTPRGNTDVLDAVIPAVTEALQQRDGLDKLVQDKATEASRTVAEEATKRAADAISGGLDAARTVPGLGGVVAGVQGMVSEAERAFLGRGR